MQNKTGFYFYRISFYLEGNMQSLVSEEENNEKKV